MAATNTTKFLYQTQADLSGANAIVNAQKNISAALKAVGRDFDDNSKIISLNSQVVTRKGVGPVLDLIATYRKADGSIEKTSAQFKKFGNGLDPIAKSVKVVQQNFGGLNSSTLTLTENLGRIITRAALTIPVWFALRTVINSLGNTVKEAIDFFIEFESKLAQVQIVGNATKDDMNKLGAGILEIGKKFGGSFSEAAEGAVTLAQQGKNTAEILKILGPAMEFSVSSGRKLSDVIQDLTAIQKSYNLTADETTRITDAINAVQLKFAISSGDLAQGLRRLGPVAAELGLSLQQTIGLLTAVQDQTRRSGEEVGVSLTTILTRFQGTVPRLFQSIAQIPVFMDKSGKATFEFTGVVRPLTDVLADLSLKWNSLTENQKQYIGVALAGKHQVASFLALMNNFKETIDATNEAYFSTGETLKATNIILDTTKSRVERLHNSWLEFLNTFRPATTRVMNAFLATLDEVVKLHIKLANSPEALAALRNVDHFQKESEAAHKDVDAINNLIGAYEDLKKNQERLDSAQKRTTDPLELAAIDAERKKRNSNFIAGANKLSGLTGISFSNNATFSQIQDSINSNTEKILIQKFAKERIQAIADVQVELNKLIQEKANTGVPITAQDNKRLDELNKQIQQKQDQIKKLQDNSTTDIARQVIEESKNQLKLQQEKVQSLETETAIIQKIKDKKEQDTILGKSQVGILNDQLDLLRKLAAANGLTANGAIIGPTLRDEERKLEIQLKTIENQRKINDLSLQFDTTLQNAIALGENDVQLQKRRIAFAGQLAQITGDNYQVTVETIKLETLLAEKRAQASTELKNSVSSALSSLIQGQSDINTFFDSIAKTIQSKIADALASAATDKIFQFTGIGSIFGDLVTSIETASTSLNQGIVTGALAAAPILQNAIVTGAQQASLSGSSLGSTLNLNSSSNPLSFKIPGKAGSSFTFAPSSSLLSGLGGNTGLGANSPLNFSNLRSPGSPGSSFVFATAANTTTAASSSSAGLLSASTLGPILGAAFGAFTTYQQAKQGNTIGATASGALTGATIGSIVPGIGTAIGALIGGLAGGGFSLLGSKNSSSSGGINQPKSGFNFFTKAPFRHYDSAVANFFDPFGVFSFLRRPKTVTVKTEEQTQNFQVSAKIDVTNKKLDVVNRNLVALKQSFDTYVLPESAYFATKRSLEDQFSLAARRGLK